MALPSSGAAVVLAAFALCVICCWLLFGEHTLAWRLGSSAFELPARVLTIFGFLSLVDKLMTAESK